MIQHSATGIANFHIKSVDWLTHYHSAHRHVYVFFEDGDESCPVIAFYSSHGIGAEVDKRRIRQKNIELLATTKAYIDAPTIHLKGNVIIDGDVTHNGNTSQTGNQTTSGTVTAAVDVVGGGKSLKTHTHGGVDTGFGNTAPPN